MTTLTTAADGAGDAHAYAPNLPEGTYEVRARQMQSAWSIWTDPQLVKVLPPVRRFEPAYWHINMPMSISAALTTTGPDGLRLDAVLRRKNDLVGLKWSSRDDLSHPQLGYLESRNYVGTVWDFAFRVTGLPGLDAGAEIEDVPGIVMTVTDDAGQDYFIRLANYLTSGTAQAGTLHLDFAGAPVFAGYDISDAAQRVTVPWDRIVEFSIGLAPPGYDPDDDAPLAEPLTISLELTDMVVSGTSALLPRRSPGQTIPTLLRMTDGYDDSYSLTPQRIVDGLVHLGYSGPYVIYIGASHLHDLVWDADAGTFQIDPAHPVALPVRRWFSDLFTRLLAAGFEPIISQSYEIYAEFCPPEWQQMDSAGNGARTGWEPPSTLIAPTVPQAMGYLRDVALTICGLLQDAGGDIHYQIGEPWWWDGSYTGGSPCIYDPATQAAYASETGNAVPMPHLASIMEPVGIHGPYLDWLSGKLGASTLWLRDAVKAAHPGMTSYVLFFTPQVLSPISEVVTRLNLPIESWRYPAFDVCQIEDYDWVAEGDWENVARTLGAATDTLGYPLNRIDYFSGFNLLPETASEVWPHITRAAQDAFGWGIRHVYVWARPQVWRDGWVYPSGRLVARPGMSPDPGLPFVPPVFPGSLLARRNSFGDVRFSFDPREVTTGHTYHVDVLDVAGEQVVRTLEVTAPALVDGRVVVDYPIELNAVDFGFPPTWLWWRVRVDGQAPVGISGPLPVDNSFVRRAVGFAGQSNALGHFTTLSGATMAQSSAAAFRRAVAAQLGLSAVEVIPVQMAWGSAAADRGADDDPVHGENYWWDLDANAPGPRLTEALDILVGLGMPLAGLIWAQGENDASAMDPSFAPRHSTPARYRAAVEGIFAAFRSATRDDLPIWFQVLAKGFWGLPPAPPEVHAVTMTAVRNMQIAIATAQPNTHIGTWVPGAEVAAGYVTEADPANLSLIHYRPQVYHAAALELAEAIATPLDRINTPPDWVALGPTCVRNSWGDIRISFGPAAGASRTYAVAVYRGAQIIRVLDNLKQVGGRYVADYPVEHSIPAHGTPPESLRWQVLIDGNAVPGLAMDGLVPLDNSWVRKVAAIGINSLGGGYFNDLSDILSPGGTGIPGRKDMVAASTFRRALANALGLSWAEVMPVQTIVGSSPINPMPYQEGFPLDNYWWDAATGQPGPNLLLADTIVRSIGRPVDYFMESGPGETTGISFAPEAQRAAILNAFEASNVAMLAWMRANWGNPALEIWFQGATTSWWGDPPPSEVNWTGAKLLRDRQTRMALTVPGFKLGSYVPHSNEWGTYVNEMASGQGWIHYSVQGYHDAAREMGEAMALNINRAASPPAWTRFELPINLRLTKRLDGALVMTWDGRAEAGAWRFRLRHSADHTVILDLVVTGRSYAWSRAAQIATYGQEAWYGVWDVAEHAGDLAAPGPFASFEGAVGGDVVAPSDLDAQKRMNGDVVFRWTARAGAPGYWYRNLAVGTGEIISEGALATNSYTFSAADQSAHYGYTVGYVRFEVLEYRAAGGVVSQPAIWDANARAPDQALDGTLPSLWADIGHGQYQLGGNPSSAEALFSRSGGTKWVVGAAGTLVEVPANTLAFDYSSGRKRMVLEGAATNLALQSATMASGWNGSRCTREGGHADPLGGMNASSWVQSDASGTAYIEQNPFLSIVAGEVYTQSIFIKQAATNGFSLYGWEIPADSSGNVSHNGNFSWVDGVPVLTSQVSLQGSGVQPVGQGWFRVWITYEITKSGSHRNRYHIATATPVLGNGAVFFGPQLEKGVGLTSLILTTTAAVTRVADTIAWSSSAVAACNDGPTSLSIRLGIISASVSSRIMTLNSLLLIHITSSRSIAGYVPNNQSLSRGFGVSAPGNYGLSIGWDGTETIMAGGTVGYQAGASDMDVNALVFGPQAPSARYEIDEVVMWPVKGSAGALQAQARVWA